MSVFLFRSHSFAADAIHLRNLGIRPAERANKEHRKKASNLSEGYLEQIPRNAVPRIHIACAPCQWKGSVDGWPIPEPVQEYAEAILGTKQWESKMKSGHEKLATELQVYIDVLSPNYYLCNEAQEGAVQSVATWYCRRVLQEHLKF